MTTLQCHRKFEGCNWRVKCTVTGILGSPLNVNGRAFTIGNVQVYGATGPDASVRSYSGKRVNLGRHEEAHTYQAQALGLGGYVGAHLALGLGQNSNPLELAADRYALGQSCSGF